MKALFTILTIAVLALWYWMWDEHCGPNSPYRGKK